METDFLPEPQRQRSLLAKGLSEFLKTLTLAGVLFLLARAFLAPFEVEGSSMAPNLRDHGRVLVNQTVYYHFDLNRLLNILPGEDRTGSRVVFPFHSPERGEVIVLNPPFASEKPYIKRVIGLPGESISIRLGGVYVDDERLDEPYLDATVHTDCDHDAHCRIERIPDGYVYVLGDNRENSADSRYFGLVRIDDIIGKAWFTNWPISDFGPLPGYDYEMD